MSAPKCLSEVTKGIRWGLLLVGMSLLAGCWEWSSEPRDVSNTPPFSTLIGARFRSKVELEVFDLPPESSEMMIASHDWVAARSGLSFHILHVVPPGADLKILRVFWLLNVEDTEMHCTAELDSAGQPPLMVNTLFIQDDRVYSMHNAPRAPVFDSNVVVRSD